MKRKGTVGSFTRWAKRRGYKSASSAIGAGLLSRSAVIRKKAQWLKNIRGR